MHFPKPAEKSPSAALSEPRKSWGGILLLLSFCLAGLCLIPFYQVLHFEFLNFDDNKYITENPIVLGGLTWSGIKWAFTEVHASNWHPLTSILFMIEASVFGIKPSGFHAVNLALHIFNSILVFLILTQSTKMKAPAFFAAALFAVHPMHIESFAWISELKDVLSTFFVLIAVFLYVRTINTAKFFILFFYILSLLSKQMYVTLAFLFLILDYWPLKRFTRKNLVPLIQEKIPYLGAACLASVLAVWAQKTGGALQSLEAVPFMLRVGNAVVAYIQYVIKMFVPIRLSIYYPLDLDLHGSTVFLSALALIILTFFFYFQRFRRPFLYSGWLFFIVTLLPVIGIVQIGFQSMANRYSYISYVGLFVMLCYFLNDSSKNSRALKVFFVATGTVVIAAATFVSRIETSYWRNTRTLFQRAVDINPHNFIAQAQLGTILYEEKKYAEAKAHILAAKALLPDDYSVNNTLGLILSKENNYDEAEQTFKMILGRLPNNPAILTNLASLYFQVGKDKLAMEYFKQAHQFDPQLIEAMRGLFNYAKKTCDFESLDKFLSHAAELKKNSPGLTPQIDWFEALKGKTLKEKAQGCEEDRKLQELMEITRTVTQVNQLKKYKLVSVPKIYKTY